MVFGEKGFPLGEINFREKGIGFKVLVNDGEVKLVSEGKKLAIDRTSSDDEVLGIGIHEFDCMFDRVGHGATGDDLVGDVGDDNAATIWQGPDWQRIEGSFSHDNGVPGCQGFETLEVGWDMPKQLVVLADGFVFCYGYND